MHVLETMVANDPGGRVTVTFLGEDRQAVEVHMPRPAEEMQPRELVEKAKLMLLDAAATGDRMPSSPDEEAGDMSAAAMTREKLDPYASAPGDDDDNAYQSPDEALPDDREEAALDKSISREATRFDQID